MRIFTPVVFLLAGFWVQWSNAEHPDRVLTLPFMDVFTADVYEQGRLTVYVCWAIAGCIFSVDLLNMMRRPPRPPEA